MLNRAYSILDVKSFDDTTRVIRGMATTPTPDRVGDVVEPMGIKVAPVIPLFLYHDSTKTVGTVRFQKPTSKGVMFEAHLPSITEPGALKDRVDEAWQMVKYGLIAAVSIGFSTVADKVERLKSGGLRFLESEVLELSLVPVPANAEALVTSFKGIDGHAAAESALIEKVKSADTQTLAAIGLKRKGVPLLLKSPGASGTQPHAARRGVLLIPKAKS